MPELTFPSNRTRRFTQHHREFTFPDNPTQTLPLPCLTIIPPQRHQSSKQLEPISPNARPPYVQFTSLVSRASTPEPGARVSASRLLAMAFSLEALQSKSKLSNDRKRRRDLDSTLWPELVLPEEASLMGATGDKIKALVRSFLAKVKDIWPVARASSDHANLQNGTDADLETGIVVSEEANEEGE